MKTGKCLFIILVITMLSVGSGPLKAQPNTLYFMKGIPQTKDLNPARPGISSGFYISMPVFSKIDLSVNANNWSYNDLIHFGTGLRHDSLVYDFDKFIGKIGENNFVYESAALTVLEAGYKKGGNFYSFSLSEREFAQLFFHRNLVDLIMHGNYKYIGETYYSGNFGIGIHHYREFALNYARDVTKRLTVGGAAKILFGMGAVQTNGINIRGTSPANNEFLDVTATGRVSISAPVSFSYNSLGEITSVSSFPNYTTGDYLSNFNNPGIAADLGFAYLVNRKLELSASIIDLGIISWNSNVTRLTEQGQFLYRGINFIDHTQDPPVVPALRPLVDQLKDSIAAAFRPDNAGTGFSTLLPAKIYFGIDYKLGEAISLSGLSRVRIINNTVHTSFTTSANAIVSKKISLSASYSVMESTYDNLGVGIGIRISPFQIYAAADNMFSPFYPATAKNMNLRIGINIILNDESKSNKKTINRLDSNCHCPY
jgi:hypothetical protein